jgi:hypothetical protein
MVNTPNSSSETDADKLSFGTIRNAVQNSAERLARGEGKKKPKKRHYNEIFDRLGELKKTPKLLKMQIMISAKDKELKDELGRYLDDIFQIVWTKTIPNYTYRIRHATEQMEKEKELDPNGSKERFLNSLNEIIKEMGEYIRKDPLITHSFITEKEKGLLEKAISFHIALISELVESADGLIQEQK